MLGVADKVIDAVKAGKIRRFFLIGGCDGAKPGRNYYTEFAQKVPKDCVILTLACGKYRFNKLDFGDIGGIPRLLDVGQCNDAYSAIQIAVALAGAFKCGVNDLPLSHGLSWYEQKAVAILLTLLPWLKNIRLGPTLPAFVTPAVLKVLEELQPDADHHGRCRSHRNHGLTRINRVPCGGARLLTIGDPAGWPNSPLLPGPKGHERTQS